MQALVKMDLQAQNNWEDQAQEKLIIPFTQDIDSLYEALSNRFGPATDTQLLPTFAIMSLLSTPRIQPGRKQIPRSLKGEGPPSKFE